jgi:hypothetical protein
LYLAKQTEYNQNLPTVQQVINTFKFILLMVLLAVATNKYSQQGIIDNEILNTYKFLEGVEKMN